MPESPSQVVCPACGGVVIHHDLEELVRLAQRHTMDAHQYLVPVEHVRQAVEPADPDLLDD